MRILHTSDWHLGQYFMGQSREAEHQHLIDWLLEQVVLHQVDAVVLAGDIFDTGAPPSYARALYNQLIVRLHQARVALLLLAGNHDSVSVLGESTELLAQLGTQVVSTTMADEAARHVLTLPLRSHPTQPGCIVCALPFIRPRDVQSSRAGESANDKQRQLQNAIQNTYAQVFAHAQQLQQQHQQTTGLRLPIVATGHLTTVGASSNESVREIYVGSLEAFPTAAFPPADYIALGHIHQPQKVGGLEHIRYCGSPIALGFDEARQTKQVLLVDMNDTGLVAVHTLPVPVLQVLQSVSGTLDSLPAQLAAVAQQASAASPPRPVWLEVTVTQDDYLPDLSNRVEAMVQDLPLQVLRVKRQRTASLAALQGHADESLDELSPHDVFARRLQQEALSPPLQSALQQRFDQVVQQLQAGGAA